MEIHSNGSVTLTSEEVRWLNENFQGGTHVIRPGPSGGYTIADNECDECGWGNDPHDSDFAKRHRAFMDAFTDLT